MPASSSSVNDRLSAAASFLSGRSATAAALRPPASARALASDACARHRGRALLDHRQLYALVGNSNLLPLLQTPEAHRACVSFAVCGTAATVRGGSAIVMAQMQATQLVTSGLWGLLYYREIRGRAMLVWIAFALWTITAVVLLGMEKGET